MKSILRGEKKLLAKSDVKQVKVTKYDELAVKTMYPILIKRPEIKVYFPDKFPKGRSCDKSYFWNVANTIFPQEVSDLIKEANAMRFKSVNEDDQNERIHVTKEWMDLLNAHPFRSSKKGKFIHLLKEGSKPILKIKARKKYPAMDLIKKIEDGKRMRLGSEPGHRENNSVILGSKRKLDAEK